MIVVSDSDANGMKVVTRDCSILSIHCAYLQEECLLIEKLSDNEAASVLRSCCWMDTWWCVGLSWDGGWWPGQLVINGTTGHNTGTGH